MWGTPCAGFDYNGLWTYHSKSYLSLLKRNGKDCKTSQRIEKRMVQFYSKAIFISFLVGHFQMNSKSKLKITFPGVYSYINDYRIDIRLSLLEVIVVWKSDIIFRTTLEEWTPNEQGGFDVIISEPLVNDYEYWPFAFPVSDDFIQLECPEKT